MTISNVTVLLSSAYLFVGMPIFVIVRTWRMQPKYALMLIIPGMFAWGLSTWVLAGAIVDLWGSQ